jgi:hypothetical protein
MGTKFTLLFIFLTPQKKAKEIESKESNMKEVIIEFDG